MSWLTEYVRPKIRTLLGQREPATENLWVTCPACEQMMFHTDLEKNLKVCTHCGHHMRPSVPSAWPGRWTPAPRSASSCRARRPIRCGSATPSATPTGSRRRATRPSWRMRWSLRTARSGVTARWWPSWRSSSWAARWSGRGRGHRGRGEARRAAGCAAGGVHRLGRRTDAGGRGQPDADAAHGDRHAAWSRRRGLPFIVVLTDPDHRRRDGQLRHAG